MSRLFRRILPQRVNGRSLVGTALTLFAILFLINYLIKVANGV